MRRVLAVIEGADGPRIVPPSGLIARLLIFVAAVMAFLVVFGIALLFTTDRLAERWASELSGNATIRLSAPPEQMEAQLARLMEILAQTPGVAEARPLSSEEAGALLEPWFGPDLPVDILAIPRLVEITQGAPGFDTAGLRARLEGEVPGAVLDDHARWREPLVAAADRVRLLGWVGIALVMAATGAIVTLAANAALAANAQIIAVLRLVGARDVYVARAFTHRFATRTAIGSLAGVVAGIVCLLLLPSDDSTAHFLSGLGLEGAEWFALAAIPPVATLVAYVSTRTAALRELRETR